MQCNAMRCDAGPVAYGAVTRYALLIHQPSDVHPVRPITSHPLIRHSAALAGLESVFGLSVAIQRPLLDWN